MPNRNRRRGSPDREAEEHLNGKSSRSRRPDSIATTMFWTARDRDEEGIQIAVACSTWPTGRAFATAYALSSRHTQIVYLFGTIACLVYIAIASASLSGARAARPVG